MYVEEDEVMQCLVSQFLPLCVVFGDEWGKLGFGNLYLDFVRVDALDCGGMGCL